MLCIPLISRDNEVVGILQAINRRKNADFTPHDIPVFQALGAHITAAIQRTRHIDQLHHRLKMKDAAMTQLYHHITESFHVIREMVEEDLTEIEDVQAKEILNRVKSRIQSMSETMGKVRVVDLDSGIDLGFYLSLLSERINEMLASFGLRVRVEREAFDVHVKQERALLCGLTLNELLVNVYQHSIVRGDETRPSINIHLSQDDETIKILVADEGLTLPEELDLNKKQSIGLWLVDDLLKKMDGTIEAANREDARFLISFKVK